jgi:hypothetical protein
VINDKEATVAYELENIESQISKNIIVAASENIEFDIPMFLQELDVECFKVKRAFRHQVVSFENERLIKRYFHYHQESLIDLIDSLHTDGKVGNDILQSVLDRLAGLLQYLEQHFPEYFNQDMKMPLIYRQTIINELEDFINLITLKFTSTNADVALIDLIKRKIDSHTNANGGLTFRQFYYLKLLRLNLESMNTSQPSRLETMDLIKVLLHCNFNTESFHDYVLRYIRCSIEKLPTLGEKLDQLTFYLKFSNQESSNQAIAYDTKQSPISVQISEWLSQEVMYLKTKQQLFPTISAEEILPSEFKLNFDLSVPQLACLFRAFIEAGVIQNKNTSELIRFLTKYVKTKRSESISYESFRIKYYSLENGTKDAVKKTLQSVLNFMNKY